MINKARLADQAALVRVGRSVRDRLMADPAAYRVPVDNAEMFAVGDFLSAEERRHLIAMIDRVAKPSTVYQSDAAGAVRTSYSGDVDPADVMVRMIDRRICDLLGIDPTWSESAQGQRYSPGQEFKGHFDWFDTTAPYWSTERQRGGQRSWTAMVYLNDVEEGGETDFPHLDASIAPQAGALLAWNNMQPDGAPNPYVLHAAKPVVRGVKYVVTKWFRTRPWGQ